MIAPRHAWLGAFIAAAALVHCFAGLLVLADRASSCLEDTLELEQLQRVSVVLGAAVLHLAVDAIDQEIKRAPVVVNHPDVVAIAPPTFVTSYVNDLGASLRSWGLHDLWMAAAPDGSWCVVSEEGSAVAPAILRTHVRGREVSSIGLDGFLRPPRCPGGLP